MFSNLDKLKADYDTKMEMLNEKYSKEKAIIQAEYDNAMDGVKALNDFKEELASKVNLEYEFSDDVCNEIVNISSDMAFEDYGDGTEFVDIEDKCYDVCQIAERLVHVILSNNIKKEFSL